MGPQPHCNRRSPHPRSRTAPSKPTSSRSSVRALSTWRGHETWTRLLLSDQPGVAGQPGRRTDWRRWGLCLLVAFGPEAVGPWAGGGPAGRALHGQSVDRVPAAGPFTLSQVKESGSAPTGRLQRQPEHAGGGTRRLRCQKLARLHLRALTARDVLAMATVEGRGPRGRMSGPAWSGRGVTGPAWPTSTTWPPGRGQPPPGRRAGHPGRPRGPYFRRVAVHRG
jgi:hypothetical protein